MGCAAAYTCHVEATHLVTLHRTTRHVVYAATQDWGARDPYAGEIVTGFGSTPLGGADTMHVVKWVLTCCPCKRCMRPHCRFLLAGEFMLGSAVMRRQVCMLSKNVCGTDRPPDGMGKFVGLKSKRCTPCEGGNVPKLSQTEAESLRIQVITRHYRCVTAAYPAVAGSSLSQSACSTKRFLP
jgi:hypothetical protein